MQTNAFNLQKNNLEESKLPFNLHKYNFNDYKSAFALHQKTVLKPFGNYTSDEKQDILKAHDINLGCKTVDETLNAHDLEHYYWHKSLTFSHWLLILGSIISYAVFDASSTNTILKQDNLPAGLDVITGYSENTIKNICYSVFACTFLVTFFSKASAFGNSLNALELDDRQRDIIDRLADQLHAITYNNDTIKNVYASFPDDIVYNESFEMALLLLAGKYDMQLHITRIDNMYPLDTYLENLRENDEEVNTRVTDTNLTPPPPSIKSDEDDSIDSQSFDDHDCTYLHTPKENIIIDADPEVRKSLSSDNFQTLHFVDTNIHNRTHSFSTWLFLNLVFENLLIIGVAFLFELNKIISFSLEYFDDQGWIDLDNIHPDAGSFALFFFSLVIAYARAKNNNSLKSSKAITEMHRYYFECKNLPIKETLSYTFSKEAYLDFWKWCNSENVLEDILQGFKILLGAFVAAINIAYYVLLAYYIGTTGFDKTIAITGGFFNQDSAPSWIENGIWAPTAYLLFLMQMINQLVLTLTTSSNKVMFFTRPGSCPKYSNFNTLEASMFTLYLLLLIFNTITFGITGYLTAHEHFSPNLSLAFAICSGAANFIFSLSVANATFKNFMIIASEIRQDICECPIKTQAYLLNLPHKVITCFSTLLDYFYHEEKRPSNGMNEMSNFSNSEDTLTSQLLPHNGIENQGGSTFDTNSKDNEEDNNDRYRLSGF